MPEQFLVQFYEEVGGKIRFNDMSFELGRLGREIPHVGDYIIAEPNPDFESGEPRNLDGDPNEHKAFEIVSRYFLPSIERGIVKLLVKRRDLTGAEQALFNVW
jgi:hypothetical protein